MIISLSKASRSWPAGPLRLLYCALRCRCCPQYEVPLMRCSTGGMFSKAKDPNASMEMVKTMMERIFGGYVTFLPPPPNELMASYQSECRHGLRSRTLPRNCKVWNDARAVSGLRHCSTSCCCSRASPCWQCGRIWCSGPRPGTGAICGCGEGETERSAPAEAGILTTACTCTNKASCRLSILSDTARESRVHRLPSTL
jgi:hypothetical protein